MSTNKSSIKLIRLKVVDSTNNYLKRHRQLPHGTVVWAAQQKEGRGKGMRRWHSDKKSLCFSLLLKLSQTKTRAYDSSTLLTQQAAVAICKSLDELRLAATIKWPNDILLNDKKVGGILIEKLSPSPQTNKEEREIFIVGIGINAMQTPEELNTMNSGIHLERKEQETLLHPTSLLVEHQRSLLHADVLAKHFLLDDSDSKHTTLNNSKKEWLIEHIAKQLVAHFENNQENDGSKKTVEDNNNTKQLCWQIYWQKRSRLVGKHLTLTDGRKAIVVGISAMAELLLQVSHVSSTQSALHARNIKKNIIKLPLTTFATNYKTMANSK